MTVVKDQIATLKIEHRDLDEIIDRLSDNPIQDDLQLRRLKRRKLLLKDQITLLEQQLVPDVPA
ncbi:MAG: YdcH family protein [Burkholderiales bacterium]